MSVSLTFNSVGVGDPLIILHGLFGCGRNWAGIARVLSATWRVIMPDLRNHGASPWSAEMAYPDLADDIREMMAAIGIGSACIIGHSLGGKAAMSLALRYPALVDRLVVADIAPVIYEHSLSSYACAMQALDLLQLKNRADADAQLFGDIPNPAVRGFLLQNLLWQDGRWRWRLNLDTIIKSMPAISGVDGIEGEGPYAGPVLFLRGERSDYVTQSAGAAISRLFPRAEIKTVAGAGHWLHAEQPKLFLETLTQWLIKPKCL